jgi:hypothetical protein
VVFLDLEEGWLVRLPECFKLMSPELYDLAPDISFAVDLDEFHLEVLSWLRGSALR